jgi:hypothetical protein
LIDGYADPVPSGTGKSILGECSFRKSGGDGQDSYVDLNHGSMRTIDSIVRNPESANIRDKLGRNRSYCGAVRGTKEHQEFIAPNPEYRRRIVGKRPFEAVRHRCQHPVSRFIPVLVVDPDEAIDIHQTARRIMGVDLAAEAISVRT